MTDDELVAAFEATTLPAETFTHAAHVRVAWWYLRQGTLPEALLRFSTALRRFADAKGATGKYHETVTVAWMLILAERLDGAYDWPWPRFAEANPDLLGRPSILTRYYKESTLASDRAKRAFVMPDRTGEPADAFIKSRPYVPQNVR